MVLLTGVMVVSIQVKFVMEKNQHLYASIVMTELSSSLSLMIYSLQLPAPPSPGPFMDVAMAVAT